MFRSLFRLGSFLTNYRGTLASGIFAFLISRILEASIPLFLKNGIDTIAGGSADVLIPVLGIIVAVIVRFGVVSYARIAVRIVGLNVAFDLRERLYAQLQRQGARFFSQFTIGDMMTRAIADISLVQ
ncbi:MAG: ABC transporter transmembrane domain-containing protein, partial [Proteobacteria bacterium]|nr:ABC transporter transmembrane domain-containing protein [Pseudomonadota bacterium]